MNTQDNRTEEEKEFARQFARSGGAGLYNKYGVGHMKAMSKLAVKKRWGNHVKKPRKISPPDNV